ncbi:YciI family protein [Chitinophaga ginsengisoli]|uniref:YCII-related domain-containing protein n=1 Tax=Chitinophaga ginsengisoli TaxID=363837 RepID=A0A2P8GLT7_9BACT|nr:YciI family protein [Chitinophaga ginsengisoli]PSL34920.1 hypothetical protein CLV42_102494 [Chitinophaga ginsengisoli]
MKDFLLIYRADYGVVANASPEEMQVRTQGWMDWIAGIAAQNKLTDRGNRLMPQATVLKNEDIVTDGPFAEIKESIMGYSIIKATSMEEAAALSKGCPIFKVGGTVEVREINAL